MCTCMLFLYASTKQDQQPNLGGPSRDETGSGPKQQAVMLSLGPSAGSSEWLGFPLNSLSVM